MPFKWVQMDADKCREKIANQKNGYCYNNVSFHIEN